MWKEKALFQPEKGSIFHFVFTLASCKGKADKQISEAVYLWWCQHYATKCLPVLLLRSPIFLEKKEAPVLWDESGISIPWDNWAELLGEIVVME